MPARPHTSHDNHDSHDGGASPSLPAPIATHEVATHEIATLTAGQTMIVASNRGPVEFYTAADGRLLTKRGAGGVVTALASFARDVPLTWIATTMTAADRAAFADAQAPARTVRLGRQPLQVRYVPIPPDMYRRYYDEVSNETLWFLQHYMWSPIQWPNFGAEDARNWDEGYRPVNEAIANAIADEADEALKRSSAHHPAIPATPAAPAVPAAPIMRVKMAQIPSFCCKITSCTSSPRWYARVCRRRRSSNSSIFPGRRIATGSSCPTASSTRSMRDSQAMMSSVSRPTAIGKTFWSAHGRFLQGAGSTSSSTPSCGAANTWWRVSTPSRPMPTRSDAHCSRRPRVRAHRNSTTCLETVGAFLRASLEAMVVRGMVVRGMVERGMVVRGMVVSATRGARRATGHHAGGPARPKQECRPWLPGLRDAAAPLA